VPDRADNEAVQILVSDDRGERWSWPATVRTKAGERAVSGRCSMVARRRNGSRTPPQQWSRVDELASPMWGGGDRLSALSAWWAWSPVVTGRLVGVSKTGTMAPG
jgi:hypothetical protein